MTFSGGLYLSSPQSSWFTGGKQGTLNFLSVLLNHFMNYFLIEIDL